MSKRILVVEDQADNRQIIRDMRGDVGAWKGLVAVSGRELIIAARLARLLLLAAECIRRNRDNLD